VKKFDTYEFITFLRKCKYGNWSWS